MTTVTDRPLFRDTTFNPGFRDCARIQFSEAIRQTTRNWTREEINAMAVAMVNVVIETSNTRAVIPCDLVWEDDVGCDPNSLEFQSQRPVDYSGWPSQDELDRYLDRLDVKEHGPVEYDDLVPTVAKSVIVLTFVYRKCGSADELILTEVFHDEDEMLAWVEDEYPDLLDGAHRALRDGEPVELDNVVMQIARKFVHRCRDI